MAFGRRHTRAGINPLDEITYEKRASKIKNPDGSIVFETKDAEIPSDWSQLASDIAISKYFRKAGVPRTGSETSVKQLVYRIAHTIREHGENNSYFASAADADAFEAELSYLMVTQRGAFNSPVWFNVGLYHRYGILGSGGNFYFNEKTGEVDETPDSYSRPQASACFIQSVEDDLMSIFDLCKNEARIFKFGSGTGTNFSKIRGCMEKLSGGGISSGLMSFLEVLDRGAGATKSGGTTRRAAKMVSLDVDHPEIRSFVNWKVNEEKKVAALVASGYSSDFNGEAYKTVAGQNSNNSVRLSDEFMRAVAEDKPWSTRFRTTGEVHETFPARQLFDEIASAAFSCADPGVQFDSTINRWHTAANTDRINGSNPCSEYMFLDDSACNLASVNLLKYMDEATGKFDVEGFRHACRTFFLAQEILVSLSSYPTAKIAKNSHDYRPLGLGYANLGTLLMVNGIPYDSDAGRAWCGAITAIMHGEAFATSAEIAKSKGPFAGFAKNRDPMLKVMRMHRAAADQIPASCPGYLLEAARETLTRAVKEGEKHGYRNAQATVLAPTGTIGLLMDCDTTGIEPDFALVKFKKLAGGGYFKIVNQSVPRALKALGYAAKDVDQIIQYVVGTLTLEGASPVNAGALRAKGLSDQDLKKIEAALSGVFELSMAFNRYNLSEVTIEKLGLKAEDFSKPGFSLLQHLGFSTAQIEASNEEICGRMTVEGCPQLKPEHLPVFDCANKCGKTGVRFLQPMSHIKMMAAAQPFLSGAISKTVNLPFEATAEDIKHIYFEGWKLGLKAIAVYRDGSKMSQPLSATSGKKEEPKSLAEADLSQTKAEDLEKIIAKAIARAEELRVRPMVARRRLPRKRGGFTQEAKVGGHKVYLRTGEYEDGSLGEIFIDMHKEGAAFRAMLNCFAISVSMGLQYGVPLEEFVDTFTFTRFEPNGMVEHENVKSSTSVVDFIFRVLAMEYLGRTDLVHVPPKKLERSPQPTLPGITPAEPAKFTPVKDSADGANQMYASLMGDAPPCSTCGHTTIRNGTCYRCLNCGNSMGCS
ncbi:MAG: vitamin B12-dependent ribonucleotide reductase [Bdellovibrionales bacterium]|nr:vitamin B12-dependent ribonucleotide reductase [Bdellovibrionales bacterium]